MKNSTITDVSLDNSMKKNRITVLEIEDKNKDKTIATLENKLCNSIIKREKLEQEIKRLRMQTESRQ